MKKIFSVLLIFVIISAVLVLSAYGSETQPNMLNTSQISAPETGDIGIIIAFAVCGATAFLTIKLTGKKNKIK